MKALLKWLGFHVHSWSDWEDGDVYEVYLFSRLKGQMMIQERRCLDCNMVKYRRERM